LLNERINRLEGQLDLSKKSVEELSRLMRKFNVQLQQEDKIDSQTKKNAHEEIDESSIAVLVMACNRALAVDEHLNQLFSKRSASSNPNKFPIIVSQDCNHHLTASAIEKHSKSLYAFIKVKTSPFKTIYSLFELINCDLIATRSFGHISG